ncbi:cellulose binding domain-containing protein [Sorangium sp. So ce448]|uniref:cellulose binding domain-containing protein n=1 Tax=Sorangium sp. So ce448 TaxID=3133314 RepID=UPI003F628CCA
MRFASLLSFGSVSIACCLAACIAASPDDEEILSLEGELLSSDGTMSAELSYQSQWSTGYCANVTVKNMSSRPSTSWGLSIALNGATTVSSWNARITQSNGQLNATNESYNGSLAAASAGAAASTTWGFCANGTAKPSITSVNGNGNGGSTSASSSSASSSSSSASSSSSSASSSSSSSSSASSGAGGAGGGGGSGGGGAGGSGGGPVVNSGLPTPPGSSNVAKPSGAAGGFRVINWAGFTGAVSYTFDDSNSSQIQNYDTLNALDVPFTFYLQTGKTESTNSVWQRALSDGHELGNHTKSHSSNDSGADTDAATQFIESRFGTKVWTMAAPNGSSVYSSIARTRFLINRGVANNLIGPNDSTDPFTLPCYIPPTGASTTVLDQQVTSARDAKKWRTVLVHGFTGGSDGAYQPVGLQAFVDHVKHSKALGDMWLDSVVNVGAYWRGQKAVSSATTSTSGGATTYTWQLPANFPPGKYLRVTVTGGTLKQNGVPLNWDPHGYYEVALDAKSVTLSP